LWRAAKRPFLTSGRQAARAIEVYLVPAQVTQLGGTQTIPDAIRIMVRPDGRVDWALAASISASTSAE
jgi:hypothetical protein